VERFFNEEFPFSVEKLKNKKTGIISLPGMKKLIASFPNLKKYFTEKNALTIMTSMFCFTMMVISFGKQGWWETIAFALAFSFSIEVICHRAKEK